MSDPKFKIGATIVRVQDEGVMPVGTVVEVCDIRGVSVQVRGAGYYGWYSLDNFEHYVEQPAVDSTAVLAPLKVFECILAGTPLECRVITSTNAFEWTAVKNPDCITSQHTRIAQYRVKPQTVVVNGVDVPKPIDTAALGYPDKVFGINLSRHSIYRTTGHTTRGDFWATEEDAQAVLDAVLTSFSK